VNYSGEGFSLDVLHDDEVGIGFFTDFVNSTNVRVVEPGCRSCFSYQPLSGPFISRGFRKEQLDGNFARELCVFRQVYFTHSARAELLNNAVMGNSL
jgi:hypothetical protein